MNVLLTCAGRRNYLVRYFQEALRGSRGKVVAVDASPLAPALQQADVAYVVHKVNHPSYFERLAEIVDEHEIRLILSLNDLELPGLAANRKWLEQTGARVVISDIEAVNLCFDKFRSMQFIRSLGLQAPVTYLSVAEAELAFDRGALTFPLVVKPRWGTASVGITSVYDREQLQPAYALLDRLLKRSDIASAGKDYPDQSILVQERLEGSEYGLDIINDLTGEYRTTVCKLKLGMRGGETDRAIIVDEPRLSEVGRMIGTALKHRGNLDCDIFLTPRGPVVLEMNPRFGGGYPFAHAAGVNLPAALVAWATGIEPEAGTLTPKVGVASAKADTMVYIATEPVDIRDEAPLAPRVP